MAGRRSPRALARRVHATQLVLLIADLLCGVQWPGLPALAGLVGAFVLPAVVFGWIDTRRPRPKRNRPPYLVTVTLLMTDEHQPAA